MDLLNYMYGNTLAATSATDLVDVLIAADKFEVICCMRYCIDMLLKLPMTQESAVCYLELPTSVLVSEIVKPLIDATKDYLAARYKNFTESQEELMELPLSALEVILGSESLEVISEDDVYDIILEWALAHYPILEERREILTERLVKFIRFTNMASSKIKEVLACPDFEHEQVSKLVMDALLSNYEHGGNVHASKAIATTTRGFLQPISTPHCFVHFDLKKDELKSLLPSGELKSQTFCVGGKKLYISAERELEEDGLDLYVYMADGAESCTLELEVAVMNKSSKSFKSKGKLSNVKLEGNGWGWPDLLKKPWTELMSERVNISLTTSYISELRFPSSATPSLDIHISSA